MAAVLDKELLWKCSENALKMLWLFWNWSNCSGTALKLLWNCSETAVVGAVLLTGSWITLKLLWNCSGTALELLWNCSGAGTWLNAVKLELMAVVLYKELLRNCSGTALKRCYGVTVVNSWLTSKMIEYKRVYNCCGTVGRLLRIGSVQIEIAGGISSVVCHWFVLLENKTDIKDEMRKSNGGAGTALEMLRCSRCTSSLIHSTKTLSRWVCTGTALELLWNCSGADPEPSGQFLVIFGLIKQRCFFVTGVEMLSNCPETALKST